ncbi:RNA polymerase sigma-70 factor (ECF subfamily) [Krasilnikovia cinnamomea]|uniref:RNA polymerase sigma-70 factor (ECF subfamily) n=1 Tax=Krasilnikovia cinnamomea TaxID=349313 RepID=A0A4V2G7P5_9ACTN|nr:sigma-70 family RNA polymerase sigma factor [Krasilnikovia cinnamomea]RZU53406.1 RNA polymerase sigma-70 factor (ECF subfamily) [Krasilnikovia cinnamomea]
MREVDDEQLLTRLSTDPAAFEEFYRRHVARVQAAAVRRLQVADDVADVVATVFVTVIETAQRFDPSRGKAVPWLYGITANVAAQQRRRRAREAQAVGRLSGRRLLQADDYDTLERQLDAARDAHTLTTVMDQLSDDERQLLELVSLDGLDPSQAAAVVGIRPATARMRLSRARRRLRALLSAATPAPTAVSLARTEVS